MDEVKDALVIVGTIALIVIIIMLSRHIPCSWYGMGGIGTVPARCISEFVK